jgi:acetolactate synthase I/II/III large subunit
MNAIVRHTGADALVAATTNLGIDVCFANPGTTELPLVKALDAAPATRAVLCLFEGVCTGAADGFGRMARRPALTLTHLGPGFANGIANLHNARRAHSPIINLIGDHASWHSAYDPPLQSDIDALARTVGWVGRSSSPGSLTADIEEAWGAAMGTPRGVATLVVPSDFQSALVNEHSRPTPDLPRTPVSGAAIADAARIVEGPEATILLIGGDALCAEGQILAAGIAAKGQHTRVMIEMFPARIERGAGIPLLGRLPYFPEQALAALAGARIILADTRVPVSYFGYEGIPSELAPANSIHTLVPEGGDVLEALRALADAVNAKGEAPSVSRTPRHDQKFHENDPLEPASIARLLADTLPEGAIVVTEGSSCSVGFFDAAATAAPHTILTNTGGAIGLGPPCAVGAALACPDRPVINLQSDGSALYTLQALWTQARERLNVVTLIVANRRYGILQTELRRAGMSELTDGALGLTELSRPDIDWVALARGLGVEATRVRTCRELADTLGTVLRSAGPSLVEMVC